MTIDAATVQALAAAVDAAPSVVSRSAGTFGAVAVHLAGGRVEGIRHTETGRWEVHVVMAADSTVSLVEADVLAAARSVGITGPVDLFVDDIADRPLRASAGRPCARRAGSHAVNERHMSLSSVRAARELLGVAPGAGEQDLRRAFRRAARVAHPDSGGQVGDVAALRAARDLLLDQLRHAAREWAGQGLHPSPQAGHHSHAAVAASPASRSRHQSKGPLIAMRTAHVGLFLGAILGFALIVEGFGEMLIVALFAWFGLADRQRLGGDDRSRRSALEPARSQRRSTVVMSTVDDATAPNGRATPPAGPTARGGLAG